jgi:hypothetical protein
MLNCLGVLDGAFSFSTVESSVDQLLYDCLIYASVLIRIY